MCLCMCLGFALERSRARFVWMSHGAKVDDLSKWVWRSRKTPAEEAHCGLLIAVIPISFFSSCS